MENWIRRSHPQSEERVEEQERGVWSVVRQENEHEDQGEGVQDSDKTATVYGAETWALKKATWEKDEGEEEETS